MLDDVEHVRPYKAKLPLDCVERVTFKCRAFTRLRRASDFFLSGQEEVTKKKATPVGRSPDILPYDFASVLRGSLNVHPCTCSELARIVRATLRAFLRPLAASQGPHLAAFPAAEAKSEAHRMLR